MATTSLFKWDNIFKQCKFKPNIFDYVKLNGKAEVLEENARYRDKYLRKTMPIYFSGS